MHWVWVGSGPNNKQHCNTHRNAPKGYGSYLKPNTHIQHTHPQHISTRTQTSTDHKSTHCNRMDGVNRRRHSWLPTNQLWDRLWSMPLPYGRLLHPRPTLINYMQNTALRTATGCTQDAYIQHPHDETLNTPHTRASTAPRLTIQTENTTSITLHPLHKHTTYFNTPRLKHYFQQRPLHNKPSHIPPHSLFHRLKNKHSPYTYIYCL